MQGQPEFASLLAMRACSKTEILERSEVDFCTQRNQQVADGDANRFWNGALCAKVRARRKIATSAHKKDFFNETEYSQVKGIPARAIRWLRSAHAPQARYQASCTPWLGFSSRSNSFSHVKLATRLLPFGPLNAARPA